MHVDVRALQGLRNRTAMKEGKRWRLLSGVHLVAKNKLIAERCHLVVRGRYQEISTECGENNFIQLHMLENVSLVDANGYRVCH